MHPDTFEQLLERAASLCGIGPGFWDIWGKYHETSREAMQAILHAKGFDATSAESLARSLAEHARRDWERLLPHSIVTGESDELELPVHVRAECLGEAVRFEIRAEFGSVAYLVMPLRDMPAAGSVERNGGTLLRKIARLPARLPLGYHEVTAHVGGERATCRIAVAPERAFTPEHLGQGGRAAGIAISLYGVR